MRQKPPRLLCRLQQRECDYHPSFLTFIVKTYKIEFSLAYVLIFSYLKILSENLILVNLQTIPIRTKECGRKKSTPTIYYLSSPSLIFSKLIKNILQQFSIPPLHVWQDRKNHSSAWIYVCLLRALFGL